MDGCDKAEFLLSDKGVIIMAKHLRKCICEICGGEFESTSDARSCKGACRAELYRRIQRGDAERTDKPGGSVQSVAARKEQAIVRRVNLYLTSNPTVSYKTLRKTNIQAMPVAV